MWSYLKSDIEELISVVKEDSNVVLEKIQDEQAVKKATAASREAERRMAMEETYLVPLLTNDGDDDDMDPKERTDIQEYLKDFQVDDKTDEISHLLEEHDILREYFEALVPTELTYEEFWSRFFYRCDQVRIQEMADAEEEAARRARAELVGSVSTFFGGAAKTIASSVADVVTTKDGRPPFVMNTAVDEDGDDEEEELGWDDDDEDEEEDEDEVVTKQKDVAVEFLEDDVIEFQDEALDNAKEQLKQTEIERDQLQQTVELLKKELAQKADSSGTSEALKKKDDEIAALKASLEQMTVSSKTSSTDDSELSAMKIRELTEALLTKDREHAMALAAIETELKSVQSQLAASEAQSKEACDSLTTELEASRERCTTMSSQLVDAKAQLGRLQLEVDRLRADVAHHNDDEKTSEDSGVPVEPPVIAKELNDDEESDGWGDDWD